MSCIYRMCCMNAEKQTPQHLTVRNLPRQLSLALIEEKRRRSLSLNQTVIELLSQSLGLGSIRRSNGLAQLAGTWTEEEQRRFEAAIVVTEQIDEELWR